MAYLWHFNNRIDVLFPCFIFLILMNPTKLWTHYFSAIIGKFNGGCRRGAFGGAHVQLQLSAFWGSLYFISSQIHHHIFIHPSSSISSPFIPSSLYNLIISTDIKMCIIMEMSFSMQQLICSHHLKTKKFMRRNLYPNLICISLIIVCIDTLRLGLANGYYLKILCCKQYID